MRRGAYYDSVSLMQVVRPVADRHGVEAALVAMATELNLDLLAGMGFTLREDVGPNDLLVAIRGDDDAAIAGGQAALEAALAGPQAGGPAPAASATPRRRAPSAPPSAVGGRQPRAGLGARRARRRRGPRRRPRPGCR